MATRLKTSKTVSSFHSNILLDAFQSLHLLFKLVSFFIVINLKKITTYINNQNNFWMFYEVYNKKRFDSI